MFDPTPTVHAVHSKEWADAVLADTNNFCAALQAKYGDRGFMDHVCLLLGVSYAAVPAPTLLSGGYVNGKMVAVVSAIAIHATGTMSWQSFKQPYAVTVTKVLRDMSDILRSAEINTDGLVSPPQE